MRYAEIVCTVKGGEVSYEWVGHWWQLAEISIQYANYFRGIEEAIKAFPWPCVVIRDDPFRLTVLIARKDHPAWLWHVFAEWADRVRWRLRIKARIIRKLSEWGLSNSLPGDLISWRSIGWYR